MSLTILPSMLDSVPLLPEYLLSRVMRWAVLPWEILILGEMGSGKTLLAEYIHQLSGRGGAFQYVSLAQVSDELAIAELSGHMKGAYTGATRDQPGPFEVAHDGTVHLDELGDSPPKGQQVLLRVLDRKEVQRVGDTRWRPVNVRLIASTNQDLEQLVRDGVFRADLLSRFGEFIIRMPPLRERREEILPLAARFLGEEAAVLGRERLVLSRDVERAFLEARWPGNIRGLRSVCRYLLAEADGIAELWHLPEKFGQVVEREQRSAEPLIMQIRAALMETGGNKTQAAKLLEMSREHLQRVLRANGG